MYILKSHESVNNKNNNLPLLLSKMSWYLSTTLVTKCAILELKQLKKKIILVFLFLKIKIASSLSLHINASKSPNVNYVTVSIFSSGEN